MINDTRNNNDVFLSVPDKAKREKEKVQNEGFSILFISESR